ncbi:hypothetical protein ACTFIZ_004689 [Dictyostelium cf. discoideum]
MSENIKKEETDNKEKDYNIKQNEEKNETNNNNNKHVENIEEKDNNIKQENKDNVNNNNNNNNNDTNDKLVPIIPLNFKKPIKNRNIRKSIKSNDDINNKENDNQGNEDNLKDLLELTKEKQKLREKGKGVNVGVLAEGPHIKQAFRELENKLDDSFTVHQDKQEVNIYLEKYVNEQLELKKQQMLKKNLDSDNDKDCNKSNDNKDENKNDINLFETPEHLKSQKGKVEEKTNWVAGIAEVQLPDIYKYKNIVETEKAKDELDKQPKNYQKLLTPQNFNQNYQYHNRHVNNKKQRNEDKATDKEAMDNFKKRFRY